MNFAVFIISHKRSDRVETYDTLIKGGYTGDLYIVVDDEDEQIEEYRYRFPNVLVFNKQKYIDLSDTIIDKKRSSALYARNAVEGFAKSFKLDVFAMLDDDITSLRYRWIDGNHVRSLKVSGGLDSVFKFYGEYMTESNIATTSFPFSMFYVSGTSGIDKKITDARHTYQIHIRNTSFPVEWKSIINQDTITELLTMQIGYLWWSIPCLVFDAEPMNKKSGGLKDVYDTTRDFDMAFLAVISNPSCCKVTHSNGDRSTMQILENKKTSYPMIVSSRYKK